MADYSKHFEFALRPQQVSAMDAITSFIKGSDKVFVLKGYAGTGKTTLMGGLIKWLAELERPYALLASTGRAAKILSDKTKVGASTIHSHIYVFENLTLTNTQTFLSKTLSQI